MARRDAATASLVARGSAELAMSIAPLVHAPNSSLASVSGSATRSVPAASAARSPSAMAGKAQRSSSSVNRASPRTAGASVMTICRTSGSSIALRNASNPAANHSTPASGPDEAEATADACSISMCTSSKTASNSAAFPWK